MPEGIWRRRHKGIVILVWLHAAALAVFAAARGYSVGHAAFEGGVIVVFAAGATTNLFSRRIRSIMAVLGLLSSSAVLVHISGGNVEMHFHFFVTVVIIALYQDWVPFLLAIGFVVLHHGTIGVLDPESVYNHAGAWAHPWLWAGIHGGFILAESVASLIAWRLSETSRAHAKLILDSAGEGIYGLDLEGNVTFANPAAASMLGWKVEEMIGEPLRPLTNPAASEEVHGDGPCPIFGAFDEGAAGRVNTDVFYKKDGNPFPVEYTSTPIQERGRITGAVVAFRDVGDQKELEGRLRQAQKMEAVGQLAGGVAHDFNNILGVIINYAGFLEEDMAKDDPKRADVEEIKKSGKRAAKLVSQLLSFSRKEVTHPVVLDLNDRVGEMRDLLRRTIRADIEIQMNLADDLWNTLIDPNQVEQILLNLALNAGDAMPDGGTLTIETKNFVMDDEFARTHPGPPPGNAVCLSVTDTGVGMSEEVRSRIFEPFYTTKPRGSGTGLGLATVYGIVKQSDGHIAVYSEPGIGSTFSVYLSATAEERAEATPIAAGGSDRGEGETVLVAEDEEALRLMIERVLSANGYRVLSAASGSEALGVSRSFAGTIDLLLTDIVMPGLSGEELADHLTGMREGMPTIFMSGYPDPSHVLDAGRGRVDDEHYIQKPFNASDLLTKIRECLDGVSVGDGATDGR